MDQKYIVAFEIGSSCIKGAVATTSRPGHVNLLAVESEPLVDKVRYGCVENPGDVASTVSAIVTRLQSNPSIAPGVIREVYAGISGRSLTSTPISVSRDFEAETEITRIVVDELMRRAASQAVSDRDIIVVEPGLFSVDGASMGNNPVGIFGHSLTAGVSLITCKPKMKNNLKRVFNERCNIPIAGYVVTPLAMGANLLTVEERRLGVMLLDCGAETTTVTIYREGVLRYMAVIPMGARNITRDITSLNCLEDRAEELKKAIGNAIPTAPENGRSPLTDGLDHSEINNLVSARAEEIIANIIANIDYAGLRPEQLPTGIVVTGGGANLKGFVELLAKHSNLKIRRAGVPANVTLPSGDINTSGILDLLSIMVQAATYNPVNCIDMPPTAFQEEITPVTPVSQTVESPTTPRVAPVEQRRATPAVNIHDNVSRIGTEDNDSDDILKDDPDDEPADSGVTNPYSRGGVAPEPAPHKRSFWDRMAATITNLTKDDSEFDSDLN